MLPQLAFVVGALCVFVAYWTFSQRRRGPLPPGPKKLPLIGNLLVMPHRLQWETFTRWGKEYNSDIIHVNALGTSIVILNSYKAAVDLLDKRSVIYSSRPHFTMWHELSGWGFLFSMLPYGDVWRTGRRMFTQHFNPSNPSVNQPCEVKYVRRFLGQLLEKPDDLLQHARTLVGSTMLSMTYSIDVRPYGDPYIEIVEEAVEAVVEHIIAGGFLVDVVPILKYVPEWFPGAMFQTKAAMMREHASRMRNATFEASKKLMADGDFEPSLVTEGLREIEYSDTPDQDIEKLKDVAAMAYVGGADSTASAVVTVFIAMVCYPEVQKRAQAELDAVLKGSLPEHRDIASLPYLSALIKEVHRWEPATPLGVPHLLTSGADDLYNNYCIPTNSILIANQWAMLNDESDYPEPWEFKPERFLKNGQLDHSVRDPMDIAFGFGRRVCPGQHLAQSTITLAAASVLSTFDILRKVDENGQEIIPKREFKPGAIRQPLDFPCVIKPRSRSALEVIRSLSD